MKELKRDTADEKVFNGLAIIIVHSFNTDYSGIFIVMRLKYLASVYKILSSELHDVELPILRCAPRTVRKASDGTEFTD